MMITHSEISARMTRAYVFALGVIAALAVIFYMLSTAMLAKEDRLAHLLDVAGEQQILAQRMAYLAAEIGIPGDNPNRLARLKQLSEARALLLANHRLLISGDSDLGIFPLPVDSALHNFFFEAPHNLDQRVVGFASFAQAIVSSPASAANVLNIKALRSMSEHDLPAALGAVRSAVTAEAIRAIEFLRLGQHLCFGAILITLAGLGLFVFRPMVLNVERANQESEQARRKLEHTALHDLLTGLPNRRYLNEHLSTLLAVGQRNNQVVGVLHLDLDRFKEVNDTFGHAAGDAVLTSVAQTMLSSIRSADFAARIGGDEFIIVCSSVASQQALGTLARRLIERISAPIPYEGQHCEIGVSIGIALGDPMGEVSTERLILNADVALYEAKSRGRGQFCYFPGDEKMLERRNAAPAPTLLEAPNQRRA